MSSERLRILVVGAHPDDAEFHVGGLLTHYGALGACVRIVSVTNGDAGHQSQSGPELSARRRMEAEAAAEVIGAEFEMWDHRDGHLEASLDVRWQLIRELRRFDPDLVLTHRTHDYHPDHRAVAHLVRDASYLVSVPAVVADVPIPPRVPVVAYMPDRFTKPAPMAPDVLIDVGPQIPTLIDMLACHVSQVFEWLPFNRGQLDEVPAAPQERRQWLEESYRAALRPRADRYREALVVASGTQRGSAIEYLEVLEISEYAAPLDPPLRARLFPFAEPAI